MGTERRHRQRGRWPYPSPKGSRRRPPMARLAAPGLPPGSTPDPKIQAALDKAQRQLAAAAAAAAGSQQSADLALNVAQQDLTSAQADQMRDQGTFATDCPQGAGGALAA